jgi:hypothetical protein
MLMAVAACSGAVLDAQIDAAPPKTRSAGALPGHMYLFWGLAGEIFSRGLDGLAVRIQKHGVGASAHSMLEMNAVTETIIRKYRADRAPVMLLGHSSGGDAIIAIANKLKEANVPVALAFGFDPTPIAGAVPSNIELFINLYQATNLIGGGLAEAGANFRGRLINVDLREHREIIHITLDKSDTIHALVVDKVVGVAAAAAGRQGEALALAEKSRKKRAAPKSAYVLPLAMRYVVPAGEPIILWDSAIAVTVQEGDTLQTIAAQHGAPAWAIAQINKLDVDNPPSSGQRLLIPRSIYSASATLPRMNGLTGAAR